jgi:hypothetical protein
VGQGLGVLAYTRFARLLKASSISARPMPRLAPVTRTALSAIFMLSPLKVLQPTRNICSTM